MTGYAEASLCLANSMRRSSAGSSARRCPHETRRKRYEFWDSSDPEVTGGAGPAGVSPGEPEDVIDGHRTLLAGQRVGGLAAAVLAREVARVARGEESAPARGVNAGLVLERDSLCGERPSVGSLVGPGQGDRRLLTSQEVGGAEPAPVDAQEARRDDPGDLLIVGDRRRLVRQRWEGRTVGLEREHVAQDVRELRPGEWGRRAGTASPRRRA